MRVHEIIPSIEKLLNEYCSRKLTGKIILIVNYRDGGIGDVQADLQKNLKKDLYLVRQNDNISTDT